MENMKRYELRVGFGALKKVKELSDKLGCSQASVIRRFIIEGLEDFEKKALETAPPFDLESTETEPEPLGKTPEPETDIEQPVESVEPESDTEETSGPEAEEPSKSPESEPEKESTE